MGCHLAPREVVLYQGGTIVGYTAKSAIKRKLVLRLHTYLQVHRPPPPPTCMHKGAAYVFPFSRESGFGAYSREDFGKISRETPEKGVFLVIMSMVTNTRDSGYNPFPDIGGFRWRGKSIGTPWFYASWGRCASLSLDASTYPLCTHCGAKIYLQGCKH